MRRLLLLLLLVTGVGCSSDSNDDSASGSASGTVDPIEDSGASVRAMIGETPTLSALAAALDASGLSDVLSDTSQSYTVFAPSNDAMDSVGPLDAAALRSHVLNTRMFSADLEDGFAVETLDGVELSFSVTDSGLTVMTPSGKSARITTPDLDSNNGVVHVINGVLGK